MCDVIGKPIQQPDGAIKWETECRRSVAPWECPLLLVDMWRPKDGFERRFEIHRKEDYEREERRREKEREREGDNCQGSLKTTDIAFEKIFFDTLYIYYSHGCVGNRCAMAPQQNGIGRWARGE